MTLKSPHSKKGLFLSVIFPLLVMFLFVFVGADSFVVVVFVVMYDIGDVGNVLPRVAHVFMSAQTPAGVGVDGMRGVA